MKKAILALALAGCGANLKVMNRVSETPGQARISLLKVDGELFMFEVINETPGTLIIDRDQVKLITPEGMRMRRPGGLAGSYMVPPGGLHRVNVKFNRDDIPAGCAVDVSFDGALTVNGYPLQVAPIRFCAD
jgi:hypothetical protein